MGLSTKDNRVRQFTQQWNHLIVPPQGRVGVLGGALEYAIAYLVLKSCLIIGLAIPVHRSLLQCLLSDSYLRSLYAIPPIEHLTRRALICPMSSVRQLLQVQLNPILRIS